MHGNIVIMRFLLTLSVLLWIQQQRFLGVVFGKKPSRPLPSSRQHQQSTASSSTSSRPSRTSVKSNEKQQRKQPTRNIIKKDIDDDVDEVDLFDRPLEDGNDDDEDDNVIPRPSNGRNQRKPPERTPPTKDNRNRRPQIPKSHNVDDEEEDEEEEFVNDIDEDEDVDDDDAAYVPPQRQQQRGRPQPQRPAFVGRRNGPPPSSGSRTNQRPRTSQQRRSSPTSGRGRNGGRVVPYTRPPPPGYGAAAALAQGWSGLVNALPDPNIVKEAAISSINAAKQTTSSLSANIYREVKGLTSSELEQVMLKATRPDDTPVKGKHVERLVGVTYQISSRYDIYDAVLRKLWSKMAERDWRTTVKALYILHRFAADGSPEHAPALKARLRELRRTRDPKRKDKFFNMKQILASDTTPENVPYRNFMSRYANYVLLRTQCFSGMFDEISSVPQTPTKSDNKKKTVPPTKPITSTSLRNENLNAAEMVLKAGLACQLKDGAICENTAIAMERVVSDMIGLTSAVAMALNRVLKDIDNIPKGTDVKLIQAWCIFYSQQLLPQTKSMIKKMSPNLDAYGLFLPSRMGTSIAPNMLEKGLNLKVNDENDTTEEKNDTSTKEDIEPVSDTSNKTPTTATSETVSASENDENTPTKAVNSDEDVVDDEEEEGETDGGDNDGNTNDDDDEGDEDEEYEEDEDEEYDEDDDDDDDA
jgi:hypothetical protein